MSINRHIAVLCNNRMALPAIQSLHEMGLLYAIGIPSANNDIMDFCSVYAKQAGIPLIILKKETLILQLNKLMLAGVKYAFTMTFPWKLPSEVLNRYSGRFYNFHYGLLPEMRGADPVFESLRQQRTETGITVHSIEEQIDCGPILMKKILPIDAFSTHGLLCTQLSYLGANILPEVLTLINNSIKGIPQDEILAKYYKRPGAREVCINWETQDAHSVQALTRACNPWNKGAYTQWNGWNIRIVEAVAAGGIREERQIPGTVLSIEKSGGITVQCSGNTQLNVDIIFTDEGFMPAYRLSGFGMKKGDRFFSI